MERSQALTSVAIVWLPAAIADLENIHAWIADQRGAEAADSYASGIASQADKLCWFPDRGSPRPELGQNMRCIVLRNRVTIAYRTDAGHVLIVAIRYAGQDWPGLLADR